ncbi:hypothetical protein ABK040_008761 [Willaertia magna]
MVSLFKFIKNYIEKKKKKTTFNTTKETSDKKDTKNNEKIENNNLSTNFDNFNAPSITILKSKKTTITTEITNNEINNNNTIDNNTTVDNSKIDGTSDSNNNCNNNDSPTSSTITANTTTCNKKDFREEYQILKVLFIGNCRKAIQSIQNKLDTSIPLVNTNICFNNENNEKRKHLPRFTIRLNTNRVNAQKEILQDLYNKHKSELYEKEQKEWKKQINKMEEIATQIFLMEYQYNEEVIKLMPDSSHSSCSCCLVSSISLMVQSEMIIDELDLSIGIKWFIRKYSLALSSSALNHFLLNHVGLLEEEVERFINLKKSNLLTNK